ncbi:MAG TPA: T9SS type A sorting domain-containing protein [Flavobacteriales bacterium]|nr:T9SS type A sorting domain-containing protein [Flavobacteriales bacterium]
MKHATISLLLVLGSSNTAQALEVLLSPSHIYCGLGGAINATISGGVPPYTFLWSTGATTEDIQTSTAGTYSLMVTDFVGTQVSEQTVVNSYSAFPLIDHPGSARAFCAGTEHVAVSDMSVTGLSPFLPIASPLDFSSFPDELFWGDYHLLVWPGATPGSTMPVSYQDANGCPGTVNVHFGYPVQFPSMVVTAVNGACASANTGSIEIALGTEANYQILDLELKRSNGQVVSTINHGWTPKVHTFTQLVPDTYWLVQLVRYAGEGMNGSYIRSLCGDSIAVTVPDLGPTCGTLNGTVYMDYNLDCVMGNSGETRVPGALLEFTPGPYYATTNSNGAYTIHLPSGPYMMQQLSTGIAPHCPAPPAPVNVSGVQTLNIADTSLVPLDVQVMMTSGPARPGFELQYAIGIANLTPSASGSTSTMMTFDPAVTFLSAIPAPTSVAGNTITWGQSSLGAFIARNINVRFQVPPNIGLIGTVLNSTVVLSTTNTDAVPANNGYAHAVTVTASYDPNDKLANTSSQYSDELYFIDVDEYIDYVIRFQNTGTDTAFTVVITDTLPPDLDPGTMIMGAASHPFSWELRDAGVIRFAFPNILLPDSNVNEPLSHGFVGFRIRPRLPVLPGTSIENIANIYFDFNPPIITEPSVLTAEFSTAAGGVAGSQASFIVFPNPATHSVDVRTDGAALQRISLLASDGRLILTRTQNSTHGHIDLADVAAGTYLLQVEASNGTVHRTSLIKQNP